MSVLERIVDMIKEESKSNRPTIVRIDRVAENDFQKLTYSDIMMDDKFIRVLRQRGARAAIDECWNGTILSLKVAWDAESLGVE